MVGHGSHLSAESGAPVYEHAARIRAQGLFDEVQEAFWKEEPFLRDALDLIESEEVFVVPLFLAEGYFTKQVVPRELGLSSVPPEKDARRVVYCPPVGVHPRMGTMILKRAIETCGLSATERRHAALVIIGHGTERSATSGDTVYRLVDDLRTRQEFGIVDCGFLDEAPRIETVIERLACNRIVLVPFFVAEGWHSRTTIPRDLDLQGERTERDGKTIWYTPPVGTLPEVAEIVVELSGEAGAGRYRGER